MAAHTEPKDVEKTIDISFAEQGHTLAEHKHRYAARTRERVRHFLHPDGRRIHVASSTGEIAELRKQLAAAHDENNFDVLLSGTPEHMDALHQAQTHHEARLTEFQEKHGQVYSQFASVHAELDALSSELSRVITHGVSLDAHFSKYGYDARIRAYDDESPTPGIITPRTSVLEGKPYSGSGRGFATPLKLFKYPAVRQYFHNGILWRGSGSEEVQSFELFVDLLYVGIIAIIGDAASEHATGTTLLHFVITFTLSWKIWNDMVLIISWFETDHRVSSRLSIRFTVNINEAFKTTYPTLIGFYLAARLYMACYLGLVASLLPMIRPIMIYHVCVTLIGAAFWIGSIYLEWPNQLALIWIAMLIDATGHSLCVVLTMMSLPTKRFVETLFEFYPAINIEHRTERMNAFVALVFGYTVVAILYQSTVNGIDAFFGKAIMGLIQAFCSNWIYFEIDGASLTTHAIRRHKMSAFVWHMAHLPFIMAFVLAGAALSRLVVAHDTPSSHLEGLTEEYEERSAAEIEQGIRWFYCAGLGVALALMGMIALSHVHKETPGLRLKKRWRLAARFCVAVVLICLPLADYLNSLVLIGVATALVVFVLVAELWASSCSSEHLFQRSNPCQYVGQCGKREMEKLVRGDREVILDELASDNEKSGGVVVGF